MNEKLQAQIDNTEKAAKFWMETIEDPISQKWVEYNVGRLDGLLWAARNLDDDTSSAIPISAIANYLASTHATLWGRVFDVFQPDSREEAVQFLATVLGELGLEVVEDRVTERKQLAAEALDGAAERLGMSPGYYDDILDPPKLSDEAKARLASDNPPRLKSAYRWDVV